MTALAAPSSPAAAALPHAPWRALALLTLAVAAAHLLLLALAPAGIGPEPLPLADRFITRTIVIAPPAPAAPAPAPVAEPVPKAAAPARPRAARPRIARPPEASTPAATTGPAVAATAEEAPATPAAEPAPEAAPANAGGAATGGSSRDAAELAGLGAGTGAAGSTPGATRPLLVPPSVRLSFAVTAQQGPQPLAGAFGELIWLQDGNQYNARLSMRFLFRTLRQWTSIGTIGPEGIAPSRYSDTRRTEVASHFVRERGQIVFSNNSPTVPLLAGAQDRLSVMMQLGAMLAGDPARYPPGSQIAVQTATSKDADVWVFTVGAEEMLKLPAGEIRAIKLTRPPRREFDLKVELWFSPGHNYLPARLVLTEPNGDFADFQMRELHPPSPAS